MIAGYSLEPGFAQDMCGGNNLSPLLADASVRGLLAGPLIHPDRFTASKPHLRVVAIRLAAAAQPRLGCRKGGVWPFSRRRGCFGPRRQYLHCNQRCKPTLLQKQPVRRESGRTRGAEAQGPQMLFDRQVTHIGQRLLVLNLKMIRGGSHEILSRVPRCPGVYSWYRNFSCPPPDTTTPKAFSEYLIQQALAKHCLDRRANVPPLYEVVLRSKKRVSNVKQQAITKLCESRQFRQDMSAILNLAFLFQQPLYVGKAEELTTRIGEHLQAGSVLQERLEEVGVQVRNCWLLCVLMPGLGTASSVETPVIPVTTTEGGDEDDTVSLSPELVVEDLLARLFHPLFTQRYG
jgi:hypothetical protein